MGEAAAACTLCLPGRFSNDTVNAACELCQFGTFQNKRGQTQCLSCGKGSFADESGLSECKTCQLWEFVQNNGPDFRCQSCFTAETFYGITKLEECFQAPLIGLCSLIFLICTIWTCCKCSSCVKSCRGTRLQVVLKAPDSKSKSPHPDQCICV